MVMIYTGNGKGKTTAALGLGLRAVGAGQRVLLVQFMKGDPTYSELKGIAYLPGFEVVQTGTHQWVTKGNVNVLDKTEAQRGMNIARNAFEEERHELVILDELNCAIDYGLIPDTDVLELLTHRPAFMSVCITGRGAPASLLDAADMVTEVVQIKHHFHAGVPAQKGIEF
ncbi:cob(I)yrinic acid a,c-diamide adenosyltransferase [bacterium]|nr:cob(I)yrinic acid a,c-diamide adenosyltransferase [bacterium]